MEKGTVKSYTMTAAVVASLKLEDSDKVNKFFDIIIKGFNSDVRKLNANKSSLTLQHEERINSLKDELEDAKNAAENAYLNIDMDMLGSNADMKEYSEDYLNNIFDAQASIKSIEETIKKAKEDFEEAVKSIDEQIAKRKEAIAKIA